MSGLTRRVMIVVALLVLVLSAIPAAAATVRDTWDESWSVHEGGRLNLSNENGSVEVQSWDRGEVRVRAEIRLKAGNSSKAREAMAAFRISASQDGDEISISSRKPRSGEGFLSWLSGQQIEVDVNYEVWVPSRFNVNVETVNGSIEVESLSGILELDSVNGRIAVRNASGAVSADTVNGSIDVELVATSGTERMTFGTTNGGITLTLPSNVQADFDAATTNGRISSDIPLTSDSFSRSRVRGTLNGGGVPIKVRTVNGSIKVTSSS